MLLKADGKQIAAKMDVARSFLAKSRGLMCRRSISPDYALLFVFARPEKVTLHMVFVPFPIDVLLLDPDMQITGMHSLKAWRGFLQSGCKVSYVVELPAGSARRHGLAVGQRLSVQE
jgi:hypothetical protein